MASQLQLLIDYLLIDYQLIIIQAKLGGTWPRSLVVRGNIGAVIDQKGDSLQLLHIDEVQFSFSLLFHGNILHERDHYFKCPFS